MSESRSEKERTFNKKGFRAYIALVTIATVLSSCSEKAKTIQPPDPRPAMVIEDKDWLSTSQFIPPLLKRVQPRGINCMVEKCIALTFDDGPGGDTDKLLDTLRKNNVRASFFVLGSLAEANPAIVKRMNDEGHEVGNHSWNHKLLTRMGAEAAAADDRRTSDAIERITGHRPDFMRPPYGSTNDSVIKAIGKPEMIWDIDPNDWKFKSTSNVVRVVTSNARKGSIALMHDIYGTTVDAVPAIIENLRSRGFTFVTVREMFGGVPPMGKYRSHDDFVR